MSVLSWRILMRILFVSASLCAVMLCLLSRAYADSAGDVTEIFTDAGVPGLEQTAPSGWHGMLGAGLFNGERILGNTRRRTVPLPVLLLTYQDRVYWSIGGGGVWIYHSAGRTLNIGAGVKLHPGYQPEDEPDLADMAKRRTSIDGLVNALWKTPLGDVGLRYYHDIADVSNGDSVTFRVSRNFRFDQAFRLTPSIGIEWLGARYVDYYYGVRPSEALQTRPAYAGRDTVNIGGGIAGLFRVSPSWSLLGGLYGTRLGGGVTDSPIVSRNFTSLVYFGVGWIF